MGENAQNFACIYKIQPKCGEVFGIPFDVSRCSDEKLLRNLHEFRRLGHVDSTAFGIDVGGDDRLIVDT